MTAPAFAQSIAQSAREFRIEFSQSIMACSPQEAAALAASIVADGNAILGARPTGLTAAGQVCRAIKIPVAAPKLRGAAFVMSHPSELHLDPRRFQYKESDERGVTGALVGVSRWESALANPITSYRDTDGLLYVVNGHQRTDLALRAITGGQEGVMVPNRILDAAEGWTPEQARALGAYQNIAEGSGTALDAAKVLRCPVELPGGVALPPLPPQSVMVRQARGLARLSEAAFGCVVNGVLPPAYAAEIGAAIAAPAEQLAAIRELSKAEPANVEQARLIVADIVATGFVGGSQVDMFGAQDFSRCLFAERAAVLDRAMKSLRMTKEIFTVAVSGSGALQAAGNKMDTAANLKCRADNESLLQTLERVAMVRGPVSAALTVAAESVARGASPKGAAVSFLAVVREIVAQGRAHESDTVAVQNNTIGVLV